MKKQQFSTAVKEALNKQKMFIKDLSPHIQTSCNTLRGWLARNSFPPDVAAKIATILGLVKEDEDLDETYDFHITRHRGKPTKTTELQPDLLSVAFLKAVVTCCEAGGIETIPPATLHKLHLSFATLSALSGKPLTSEVSVAVISEVLHTNRRKP